MFIKIHDNEYWYRFMKEDVERYYETATLNMNIVIEFKKDKGSAITLEFNNAAERDPIMVQLDSIFGVQ